MKNILSNIQKFFRKKGLFLQTFFLLLLVSIVTISVVIILINKLIVREQSGYITELRQNQMIQVSEMIDMRMEVLEKSQSQFLQNSDTISVMVSPVNADSGARSRVMQTLSGYEEEYESVSKAFLYLPYTEEVYGADELHGLGQDEHADVIRDHLEQRADTYCEETTIRSVIHRGEDMYLVTEYRVPNYIGAVFFRIDRTYFLGILEGSGLEDGLYAADGSGQWLFKEPAESVADEGYMKYESPRSGWQYYTSEEVMPEDQNIGVSLGLILSLLFGYLLLSFWVTLKLTNNIYRPISRLIGIAYGEGEGEEVEQLSSTRSRFNSEIDNLVDAYSDTIEQQQSQKELLLSLSSEIMDQLFRNILEGTVDNEYEINKTLKGISRTDVAKKKCMAMEVCFRTETGDVPSLLENSIYQRNLKSIITNFERPELEKVMLFLSDTVLSLILLFQDDCTAGRSRMIAGEMENYLFSSTRNLPYHISVGKGRIYNNVSQLRYSYQEAADDIRYQRLQSDHAAVQDETSAADRKRYYADRATQVAELAENRTLREATDMGQMVLNELFEEKNDAEQEYYELLLSPVRKRLLSYGILSEEIRAAEQFGSGETEAERHDGMAACYVELLRLLQSTGQNRKYRYVKAVQNYIIEHYGEGTLSLNEVSDAIGISAAYLSEIFSEVTRSGFSYYLNNYRVERAKEMLDTTNDTIGDICVHCGFNSAQNFARVFKKYTGFTPGQYREHVRRRAERHEES